MKQLWLFAWVCLVTACGQAGKPSSPEAGRQDTIRYAKGFTIQRHEAYILAEIADPWDSVRLLQRYVLVDRNRPLPDNLPPGTIVRTPLEDVVVYSSVHAAIIDELRETGRIAGVCEPQYMDLLAIQDGLRDGRIADLGLSTAPNIEKMIDIGAGCIIASPLQNVDYGPAGKLGIPIIEGADYMEAHPLGRAEWGRFYGLLLGKPEMADSIFRATEERYLRLRSLAQTAARRPTVFPEKRYGSIWYVPGNDSYVAHLFRDAGAAYVFDYIPGQGSTPLSFETVLDRAIHADIWLIKYNQTNDLTCAGLRTEYAPYENFDAFKNRRIYACHTGRTPYYEESPIHPDYLLRDLIHIFHPELLPDYSPRYYHAIKDE
ncbi:MAG: ABC transporter substrate-binding protein [Tannerellaceae bacterium]|jgi:iron complex transport system substrate-binding protein|nr:ABC transporter substrate-binding protein [Tannerellaceae bacterium]